MKLWARLQEKTKKHFIRQQLCMAKNIGTEFHKLNPNITKNEIIKNVTQAMEKRVARIERKQARHRKK